MNIKGLLLLLALSPWVCAQVPEDLSALSWQFAEPYLRAALEAEQNPSVANAVWRQEVNEAFTSLRRRLADRQMITRLTTYLLYSGRYQEAAESAWAGLQTNPQDTELLFMLSAAMIFEGDHSQALRLIDAAQAEAQNPASLALLRAWSLHRQGQYPASNEVLSLLELSDEAAVLVEINRAVNHIKAGQPEQAGPLLTRHADAVRVLVDLRIAKKAQDPNGQWIEMNLEDMVVPPFLLKAEAVLHESERTEPRPAPIVIVGEEE